MKVFVNALSARRGGIITYTQNLMRSFANRGVDAVFALPCDTPLEPGDRDILLDVTNKPAITRAIWEQTIWRSIVMRTKPTVLYSSANFGLIKPPVPQVLLVREGGLFDPEYLGNIAPSLGPKAAYSRMLRRKLILASVRSSDLVLTPTKAVKDLLALWDHSTSDRIQTNRYGTRLENFSNQDQPRSWRKGGVLKLLFVSAYYAHKQPGLITEAVRILNEQGLKTHLTLTMDLEDMAAAPGASKDFFLLNKALERSEVTLLGHVDYDQLPDLYQTHDLFVSPSLSETFGHPLIEAMTSQIIVMAADTSVHREVCDNAAIYFNALSSTQLAEQITKIDADNNKRRALRKRSKEFTAESYDWEKHVDRLLEHFKSIEGQKG